MEFLSSCIFLNQTKNEKNQLNPLLLFLSGKETFVLLFLTLISKTWLIIRVLFRESVSSTLSISNWISKFLLVDQNSNKSSVIFAWVASNSALKSSKSSALINSLVLMSANSKSALAVFSSSSFNCEFSNCSMQILDGRA